MQSPSGYLQLPKPVASGALASGGCGLGPGLLPEPARAAGRRNPSCWRGGCAPPGWSRAREHVGPVLRAPLALLPQDTSSSLKSFFLNIFPLPWVSSNYHSHVLLAAVLMDDKHSCFILLGELHPWKPADRLSWGLTTKSATETQSDSGANRPELWGSFCRCERSHGLWGTVFCERTKILSFYFLTLFKRRDFMKVTDRWKLFIVLGTCETQRGKGPVLQCWGHLCPLCSGLRGFLGCEIFSAKNGTVLG